MTTATLSVGINTSPAKTALSELKKAMQAEMKGIVLTLNDTAFTNSIQAALKPKDGFKVSIDKADIKTQISDAIKDGIGDTPYKVTLQVEGSGAVTAQAQQFKTLAAEFAAANDKMFDAASKRAKPAPKTPVTEAMDTGSDIGYQIKYAKYLEDRRKQITVADAALGKYQQAKAQAEEKELIGSNLRYTRYLNQKQRDLATADAALGRYQQAKAQAEERELIGSGLRYTRYLNQKQRDLATADAALGKYQQAKAQAEEKELIGSNLRYTRYLNQKKDMEAAWLAATEKDRLKAALRSANVSAGGGNTGALRGIASSVQAAELAAAKGGVQGLEAALASYGKTHTNTSAKTKEHTEAVKNHREQQAMLHSTLRGVAGGMDNLWLTYGRYVGHMIAAYAAITVARRSVEQGVEFDYQTRFVAALGPDKSANAYKGIQDGLYAIKDSPANVNELARSLRVLQQTGIDAADGLGLLRTVISASTLGETDMKTAAEDIVGVLEVFNLHAKDPVKLSDNFKKAGDIMAYVSQETKANLHDVASSFQAATGIAEQYGVSIEYAAGVMTALGKQGIVASKAGTFTRNMIEEMYQPKSSKAEKALKEIGVSAYDKNGIARDELQVTLDLVKQLEQYGPKSRDSLVADIFSERGVKAFRAISADLPGFLRSMEEASSSTGMLEKQTEELSKSTSYQLKQLAADYNNLLTKAWGDNNDLAEPIKKLRETLNDPSTLAALSNLVSGLVSIGEVAARNAPIILTLAQAVMSFMAFRVVTGTVSSLIAGITALSGSMVALGTAGTSLSRVLTIVEAGKGALLLRTVGLGGAMSALAGPFGIVAGLLAAGATAWMMWGDKGAEALQKIQQGAAGAIDAIKNLQEQQAVGFGIDSKSWTLAGDKALRERSKLDTAIRDQVTGAGAGLNFDTVSGQIVNSQGKVVTSTNGWLGKVQELAAQYRDLTNKIGESNTAATEARKAEERTRSEINAVKPGGTRERTPPTPRGGDPRAKEDYELGKNVIRELTTTEKIYDAYYKRQTKLAEASAAAGLTSREEAETEITRITEEQLGARIAMNKSYSAILKEMLDTSKATDAQKERLRGELQQRTDLISELEQELSLKRELAAIASKGADRRFQFGLDKNAVELGKDLATRRQQVYGKIENPVDRARSEAHTGVEKQYAQMMQEAVDARIRAEESGNEAAIKASAERLDILDREVQAAKLYYGDQFAELAMYQETATYGWDKFWEKYRAEATTSAQVVQGALESTTKGIEDAFSEMFKTGKFGWKQMIDSILSDLGRLLAKLAVADLGRLITGEGKSSNDVLGSIFGAIGGGSKGGGSLLSTIAGWFGFANGGVMTNRGPLALQAYSSGGVANSPQLALYGEGRTPEAYVPLPDGRSIPVNMRGGNSGPNININIHSTNGDPAEIKRAGAAAARSVAGAVARSQRYA